MTVRQDLSINQGETWSWTWTKKDASGSAVNLTGYSARMGLKIDLLGPVQVYLSTGADAYGGSIVLGGATGHVTLSFTDKQTDALDESNPFLALFADWPNTKPLEKDFAMMYDLELVSPTGTVTRELQGVLTLRRAVTLSR